MTFDEFRARAAKYLDFDFVCNTPYKACDYILMYGLIFQDYLEGYDFWGHVDPDMIWGDMGKYITDHMLRTYDRIYRNGHLMLYRNNEKVRTFALHKLPGYNISYRDIFKTREHIIFEESSLASALFGCFADMCGGNFTYQTSQIYSRIIRNSGNSEVRKQYLHSDGRTEKFSHLHSAEIQSLRPNTCICIFRRGP